MASNVIADLLSHEETFCELKNEVAKNKEIVAKRAEIFTLEAASVGLKTYPYSFGFFISIPCVNARKVSEELQKNDIYIVPVRDDVLRLALSCVPTAQISGLAGAIKKAADSVKASLNP
jgi:aromatic-amino-acid transaminase